MIHPWCIFPGDPSWHNSDPLRQPIFVDNSSPLAETDIMQSIHGGSLQPPPKGLPYSLQPKIAQSTFASEPDLQSRSVVSMFWCIEANCYQISLINNLIDEVKCLNNQNISWSMRLSTQISSSSRMSSDIMTTLLPQRTIVECMPGIHAWAAIPISFKPSPYNYASYHSCNLQHSNPNCNHIHQFVANL